MTREEEEEGRREAGGKEEVVWLGDSKEDSSHLTLPSLSANWSTTSTTPKQMSNKKKTNKDIDCKEKRTIGYRHKYSFQKTWTQVSIEKKEAV